MHSLISLCWNKLKAVSQKSSLLFVFSLGCFVFGCWVVLVCVGFFVILKLALHFI